MTSPRESEEEKYKEVWGIPGYEEFSPGVSYMDIFLENVDDPASKTLLDVGCGSGKATKALIEAGFKAFGFDITNKGLIEEIPFIPGCLWQGIPNPPSAGRLWDYIYCTDVMEHIPTVNVGLSLERIRSRSDYAFFTISNVHDGFGRTIGKPLHLTVQSFEWWRWRILEIGDIIEARDCWVNSIFFIRCKR